MVNNYSHNSRHLSNAAKPMVLTLFFFATLLLSSCSDEPSEVLDNKINVAIRSGNNIDEKEWDELTSYILENKVEFADLIEQDKAVSTKKFTDHILDYTQKHSRRGQTDPEIFSPKTTAETSFKSQIKVFIENSGSMDGYIRNTSEFEAALSDLLVQVQYHYGKKNLNVNFINTKIYPSQITEVKDFVEALEPEKTPYKVGDRTVSRLNEILKMILDSTAKENISILVSDCIYSLDKKNNTEGALEFEKSLTKGAFLEKSKQFGFATIILKMESKFTGKYWNKDNGFEQLNGASRPYYIWIIGSNDNINEFSKKVNTKSLKGFENSYFLSNFTKEKQPFFTVLKETNKVGSFKQTDRGEKQTDRGEKEVKSINDIEYDNGTLQFSIAIDLGNIPVDSAYLTNPQSYVVPDGFVVKSISKIDRNKLTQRDMVIVEKTSATHYITISTTNKFTVQDLKLELSNKIPAWVEESNSIDDRNVKNELDKTFGLSYLVQGVSEAYATQNPEQTSYFKIIVTIKK
jgi:hypothetical protein